MTMQVRDEEDVLAVQLDYHLAQGVDLVLATDDGSADGTPDILARYERDGVLRRVPAPAGRGYRQAQVVTGLARLAATEHGADWVLNADADEFFWPACGTLADVLEAVPDRYGVLAAPRNDFLPAAGGPEPFWGRMTIRESASWSPLGFRLVPKALHRAHPEIEVEHGNHAARAPGLEPAPPLRTIEVLHFPMRSPEQFDRKTANIGARLAEQDDRELALDAVALYERRQRGELDAWYAGRVAEPARVEAGLADGSLVADRRLAGFLEQGTARRPRRPAAVAQCRDAYELAAEWFDQRVAAERRAAEAERDAAELRARDAEDRVRAVEQAYAEVDANLAAERADHYRTAEDLRMLRESRAVRLARAMRQAQSRVRGR